MENLVNRKHKGKKWLRFLPSQSWHASHICPLVLPFSSFPLFPCSFFPSVSGILKHLLLLLTTCCGNASTQMHLPSLGQILQWTTLQNCMSFTNVYNHVINTTIQIQKIFHLSVSPLLYHNSQHYLNIINVYFCLSFKKYLFIFRERGKEGERERNINVWLPLARPLLGTWPATQACDLTGNQTSGPLVCRLALNLLSHINLGYFCLSWTYSSGIIQYVIFWI